MNFYQQFHKKQTSLTYPKTKYIQKMIQSDLSYHMVFSKKSNTSINHYYVLFFHNYQIVCDYYGNIMYRLITDSKILSILVYKNSYYPKKDQIIALTKSNHLFRFNLETGELISFIHLSKSTKFKNLEWCEPNNSFYVSAKDKYKDFEILLFKCEEFQLISKLKLEKSLFGNLNSITLHNDMMIFDMKHTFYFFLFKDIVVNLTFQITFRKKQY